MSLILIRFLIGGFVVSVFSVLGDIFKPKSFAGLFGAAPSIALASLGLTIAKEGRPFAVIESRSMMAGAVAFFVFASAVSWILMRYRPKALLVTASALVLWLGVAFGLFAMFR